MKHVVQYHNDFNNLPLVGFTSAEKDVLMAICLLLQNKGTSIMDVDVNEIRELTDFKPSPKRLKDNLLSMKEKLRHLNYTSINSEKFVGDMYFFSVFGHNPDNDNIWRIGVTEIAQYILTNVKKEYTKFELPEFVSVKNKYAKDLYKLLKQWRSKGRFEISIEELRTLLDIPETFKKSGKIEERIINPAIEELSPYFKDLKVNKHYGQTQKKGRPPVVGYIFTFEKQIDEKTSGIKCPRCGKPLIYKMVNNNWCWCHKDGWKTNADCSAIFNEMAEIHEERKNKDIQEEGLQEMTEDQKKNKEKISQMIAEMLDTGKQFE